jgi:Na+/H+ antiporter NhaA
MIVEKAQKDIDLMREFHKRESAGGLLLIDATVAALRMANIPAASRLYDGALAPRRRCQARFRPPRNTR